MKETLKDYKKEMEKLQSRLESLQKGLPGEIRKIEPQKKEGFSNIPQSKRWFTVLLPGLMAILMAVLFLIFLIISEVLKKR